MRCANQHPWRAHTQDRGSEAGSFNLPLYTGIAMFYACFRSRCTVTQKCAGMLVFICRQTFLSIQLVNLTEPDFHCISYWRRDPNQELFFSCSF